VSWVVPDSLWWDGTLRTGVALGPDRAIVPVDAVPAGAAQRRLPGTVLPGLCDSHVHSALVDLPTVAAGGISSVWDLGGVPASVAAVAARGMPVVRFAGPFLIAPGGYPSDRAWAPAGSCRAVRSAADAPVAVAEARAFGATLIKVTAHAGGPMLDAASLAAVVEAAHAASLPVVVHAEGPGTVAAALQAGADVLAHTPWTEELDDGLIRDCVAGMTWISTLDIHGWGTPSPAQDVAIGNLRRFLGHGGVVRYGTDLGNGPLPAGINPRELRVLQRVGLSPAEVLTAVTDPDQGEPAWVPGGLELGAAAFADSLATARVLTDRVRPRG
jgi:imidazolonepropionase-like amidohydrolase